VTLPPVMADAVKLSSGGDIPSKVRPEKPDEEQYKADLAKAEKEHATAQEDLVGSPDGFVRHVHRYTNLTAAMFSMILLSNLQSECH
jgi:hypothetical protein